MRGEFGTDAEFFHDVTKTVDGGIVIKVGTASKFLDFRAGDDEFDLALLAILSRLFDFFDFPSVRELLRAEFNNGEGGVIGGIVCWGARFRCVAVYCWSYIVRLGSVFELDEGAENFGDSLARGGGNGKNLGVRVDGVNSLGLQSDNIVVDAFTFGQGDDFRARSEVGITLELATNSLIGSAGVVVIDVDKMKEGGGAVDVTKEGVAEALAISSALDKTGDVGDEEVLVVDGSDAELRSEGRERIISDFGAGVRNAREEGGFAGVRQADETNIGEQFQLESCLESVARFANFGDQRGLTGGRFEMSIAEAAIAAFCDDRFFLVVREVGEDFVVAFDDGADWDFDDEIFAGASSGTLAGAIFAVFSG